MITITPAAACRFNEMIKTSDLLPRIEIMAGGCNGFEKRFSLDYMQNDDIAIQLLNLVTVLIDVHSFKILINSTVDYKTTVTGSFFTIEIPESVSNCGCGSSFSL